MLLTRLKMGTVVLILLVLGSTCPAAPAPPPPKEEPEKSMDQLRPITARLGVLAADLVKAKKSDAEIVDLLFTATLLRLPTEAERAKGTNHLQKAKDRATGSRDLAWSLLNTREFIKLHGLDRNLAASLHALNVLSQEWDARPGQEKPDPEKPPAKER
jgi:hypothetical protein